MLRRAIIALAITLAAPTEAAAFDLCGAASSAGHALPEAHARDPLVMTAKAVFERVNTPFRADTRRVTDLVVLAPTAQVAGAPLPPYAALCETDAAPRLYLTYALLELLRRDALYSDHFLAMILGHELGHRLRDFDAAGRWTAGPWTRAMEETADVHGAFLAAAAGYSTRQLACDDVMDLFLNVEAGVDDALRQGRKDALAQVLRSFDVYESLYDAGAALLFSDRDLTAELLDWVNRHMDAHAKRVGEFLVLEALARMHSAVSASRWTAVTAVPGAAPADARCLPVTPSHTAFWDERLAAVAAETRRGRHPQLVRAEQLLRQARALGATDLVVESGLACVFFYDGLFDKARLALDQADALAATAAPAVRDALAQDRALVAWGAWLEAHPAPPVTAPPAERQAWAGDLTTAGRDFRAHPALASWLAALARYPAPAPARAPAPPAPLCATPPPVGPGTALLPPLAAVPRSGGCPCGWSELHTLVGDDPAERVTTCVPAGWAVGQRWVHLTLPDLMKGHGLEQRLLLLDALSGPLASLDTWDKACAALLPRGVSDAGHRAFVGRCPALGADEVVLTADDACRVQRAVVVGPPGT